MKPVTAFSLGVLLLISTACNRHLSRSNAKAQLEQLAKQEQSDGTHTLLLKIGRVANCEPQPYQTNYDPVQYNAESAVLSKTGYVTIRPVKRHVWDVELTDIGRQSLAGEKYAHEQKGDCDQWQVTIPLAKYDHVDVTGIVEEGVHARVDTAITFVVTPVGMAVRRVASNVVLELDKKTYGEKLAHDFLSDKVRSLLGDDLVYLPINIDRYIKNASFPFDKYDDGWKVSLKDK
jgi:hypothetical protein